MAPTDREFTALSRKLDAISEELNEIKLHLAERRGVEKLFRWAVGGGGVAGIIALWRTIFGPYP